MQLFPFMPTWSDGVTVTYRHQTEVERLKTGGERRLSMSGQLLRDWQYQFLLEGETLSLIHI